MAKYLITLLLLSSCYTERKAADQVYKATRSYPDTVSSITRLLWPCITTDIKIDTITVTDIITVECPETEVITIRDTDTVRVTKTVKVPVQADTKYITKLETVEDSTKIFQLTRTANNYLSELTDCKSKVETLEDKISAQRSTIWIISLIGLLILAAAIFTWVIFTRKYNANKK